MLSLIAFFSVMVAVLIVCGVSSFKTERTKLSAYTFLKGLSILSVLVLGLTASNLATNINGSTIFVLLAVAIQIFSAILISIPTKDDLFKPIILGLDMISTLMIGLSGLLLVDLSIFGLPIGFGAGAIAMLIFGLVNKKNFNVKTDLFRYFNFAFACGLLGQIVIIVLNVISIQSIMFAAGAILYFINVSINTFIQSDKRSLLIAKNIFYYLSLILLTSSIFMGVF